LHRPLILNAALPRTLYPLHEKPKLAVLRITSRKSKQYFAKIDVNDALRQALPQSLELLENPFGAFPGLAFDFLSIISPFANLGAAYFLKLVSNALDTVDTSIELDPNLDVSAISNTLSHPISDSLYLGIIRRLLLFYSICR
jgi:hypothetical protein